MFKARREQVDQTAVLPEGYTADLMAYAQLLAGLCELKKDDVAIENKTIRRDKLEALLKGGLMFPTFWGEDITSIEVLVNLLYANKREDGGIVLAEHSIEGKMIPLDNALEGFNSYCYTMTKGDGLLVYMLETKNAYSFGHK